MIPKIDIISEAYAEMRVSGLTVIPSPEDLEWALVKLESMCSEWQGSRNICVGYAFEDLPDPNTDSGISLQFRQAFATNLAVRLLASFGKVADQTLARQAMQSFSVMSSALAITREVNYPNRQPRGSGNTLRYSRWWRFYRSTPRAPASCETMQITRGEIADYSVSFNSYLEEGETISSYTIDASDGLTVISDTLEDPVISYRLECSDSANELEVVTFFIITSNGLQKDFVVNFNVTGVVDLS